MSLFEPKSFLQSKVCLGALLSVVCFLLSATGRHIDKDQAMGLITGIHELWPLLIGIVGSLVGFWTRIKGFKWHRPNWKEAHFWSSVSVAVVAIGNVLDVPTDDLGKAFDQIGALAATGKVTGLITAGLMIAGSLVAKKDVTIAKATPVLIALMLPLGLCQCAGLQKAGSAAQAQWNKLSPETRAMIEQRALAAGMAAAQAASSAAQQGKPTKTVLKEASLAVLDSLQTTPSQPAQPVEVDLLP